jgi:hypothetical protein
MQFPFELPFHDQALRRRTLLKFGALTSASWLTSVASALAQQAERKASPQPAQSLIVLWMARGPSQLETFDPHPGTKIGGDTRAIKSAAPGILLADGLERLADQMASVALVRSLDSREGDHERGTMLVKTGYPPEPTVIYPSIGAICCHQLPRGSTDIPRHVSILPNQWPGRGGMLGDQYDAFRVGDPTGSVPDISPRTSAPRYEQRLKDLSAFEQGFARGRGQSVKATLHQQRVADAGAMMTSEQLKAFDVSHEPLDLRKAYGETPFGRGCLAARRLIEVGVRCVEVTLDGWDTHANNHEGCRKLKEQLDPAFAALVGDLKQRDLWDRTLILCAGEFGRTPAINRLEGRDHWPHGFSAALAGGKIRGGQAIGATDPAGGKQLESPHRVADVHATLLTALGIDPLTENTSAIGRPIKLSDGTPIKELQVNA